MLTLQNEGAWGVVLVQSGRIELGGFVLGAFVLLFLVPVFRGFQKVLGEAFSVPRVPLCSHLDL